MSRSQDSESFASWTWWCKTFRSAAIRRRQGRLFGVSSLSSASASKRRCRHRASLDWVAWKSHSRDTCATPHGAKLLLPTAATAASSDGKGYDTQRLQVCTQTADGATPQCSECRGLGLKIRLFTPADEPCFAESLRSSAQLLDRKLQI